MTGGRHGLGVTSEATWKPRSQQGRKAHGVFLNTRSSVRPAHRGRQRRRSSEGAPLGSASICSPGRSLGPAQPRTRGHTRGRTTCNPTGQNRTRLQQNKRRGANPRLKPTRRTHPAGRSHLGLAGRWLRWSRVGGRAEHDCIELAVGLPPKFRTACTKPLKEPRSLRRTHRRSQTRRPERRSRQRGASDNWEAPRLDATQPRRSRPC